jgi:hypothetical protein
MVSAFSVVGVGKPFCDGSFELDFVTFYLLLAVFD